MKFSNTVSLPMRACQQNRHQKIVQENWKGQKIDPAKLTKILKTVKEKKNHAVLTKQTFLINGTQL